jgi:hypothetical protein
MQPRGRGENNIAPDTRYQYSRQVYSTLIKCYARGTAAFHPSRHCWRRCSTLPLAYWDANRQSLAAGRTNRLARCPTLPLPDRITAHQGLDVPSSTSSTTRPARSGPGQGRVVGVERLTARADRGERSHPANCCPPLLIISGPHPLGERAYTYRPVARGTCWSSKRSLAKGTPQLVCLRRILHC